MKQILHFKRHQNVIKMSIRNHLHLTTDTLEPNWMQTKLESMNLVVMETSEFHMTTCYEIFHNNAL